MTIFRLALSVGIPLLHIALMVLSRRIEFFMIPALTGGFVITDIALAFLLPKKELPRNIFSLSLSPLLLYLGSFGLLFFIETERIAFLIIGAQACLQLFYFIRLFQWQKLREQGDMRALFHIASAVNAFGLFGIWCIFFGLIFLLDVSWWYLILPLVGILALVLMQGLLFHSFSLKAARLWIILIVVLTIEMSLVVLLLPAYYFVLALFAATWFHALFHYSLSVLQKEMWRGQALFYFFLFLGVVFLGGASALWR